MRLAKVILSITFVLDFDQARDHIYKINKNDWNRKGNRHGSLFVVSFIP